MGRLRIAVITSNGDTFSNPSLIALFSRCKERDLIVDLYGPAQTFEIASNLDNINVYKIEPKKLLSHRLLKIALFSFAYLLVLARLINQDPICIIGVDPEGIVLAGRLNRLLRKRLVYFSFEIFFKDEIKNLYYLNVKNKEEYYSNRSDIIVIQDNVRMKMLATENEIRTGIKWHYVPVAPLPIQHELKPFNLTEKYRVPPGKTVVVLSGSIASWSGIDYVIYALEKGIHPDTWIFIHSRFKLNPANVQHRRLFELERAGAAVTIDDIYFSDESAYFDFLSSFDFGLVLYIPDSGIYVGKNIKHIGLASGKFASYCMLGLSVIFHNDALYNELNTQYDFGCCVSNKENFAELLARPLGHSHGIGSKRLYYDMLMPANSIDRLIDEIKH